MQIEPAVTHIQALICPKLEGLIEHFSEQQNHIGSSFFAQLLVQLRQAKIEEDLLAWCIELSKAAFVGITYDQEGWDLTDEILADAEQVSMAFSVSSENAH